jgi:hypothetical protein
MSRKAVRVRSSAPFFRLGKPNIWNSPFERDLHEQGFVEENFYPLICLLVDASPPGPAIPSKAT